MQTHTHTNQINFDLESKHQFQAVYLFSSLLKSSLKIKEKKIQTKLVMSLVWSFNRYFVEMVMCFRFLFGFRFCSVLLWILSCIDNVHSKAPIRQKHEQINSHTHTQWTIYMRINAVDWILEMTMWSKSIKLRMVLNGLYRYRMQHWSNHEDASIYWMTLSVQRTRCKIGI